MRLLISILVANRNVVITADRLTELLWPDGAPRSATTSIQVSISQLRRILEPRRAPRTPSRFLITEGEGYRLDLPTDAVDLDRLESTISAAERKPSTAALDRVDSLLSGPIFAEFEARPWALPIVETLRARRHRVLATVTLDSVERRSPLEILARVRDESAKRPTDEQVAGLLMLVLFAAGDQVGALRHYQEIRATLARELGLEPTIQLRQLERSILEQDPTILCLDRSTHDRLEVHSAGNDGDDSSTRLIGRSEEIGAVASQLARSSLVTIVGPPGVGKSALARYVTERDHRRRTVTVDLAQAVGSDLPQIIATSAGIVLEPGRPQLETLLDALSDASALVLLDNCEVALDAAAEMAAQASNIAVLATSRKPLGLRRESIVPLGPLAVPANGADLARAQESPAIQLLTHCAGLALDATNVDTLTQISRRLDGLPLAIELGAHRLRSGPPEHLLALLESESDLVGPRDVDPHQRSIDAALDRSLSVITSTSEKVFLALGTCRGPIPVGVLALMLSDQMSAEQVLRSVDDLLDRSLAFSTPGTSAPRYGLLEPVRAYSRRRARVDGRDEQLRRSHLKAIASVAGIGPHSAVAASELEDVDAELGRALDQLEEDPSSGALHHSLLAKIGSYWYRSGRLVEAHERMQRALDLHPDIDPVHRGLTLAALGLSSFSTGDFRRLDRLLEEAIDLLGGREVGGLELLEAARHVGRQELELALDKASIACADNAVNGLHRVIALDIRAFAAWAQGHHADASEMFQEQERTACQIGDAYFEARATRGRALMLALTGEPESAAMLCEASARRIDDWTNDRGVTQHLAVRAAVELESGQVTDARRDALAAIRRASHRYDALPMMLAVPVLAAIELEDSNFANVARATGWLRGVCRATGIYPPDHCERLVERAERAARTYFDANGWSLLRTEGSSQGLVGLHRNVQSSRT